MNQIYLLSYLLHSKYTMYYIVVPSSNFDLHMHRKKYLQHLPTIQNDLCITSVQVWFLFVSLFVYFSLKGYTVFNFSSEVSYLLNKTSFIMIILSDCSCFFILQLFFICTVVLKQLTVSFLNTHFLILRYIARFSIAF